MKIGTITKEQLLKANKKASREIEMDLLGKWTAKHKVHKSKKDYTRKEKHKAREW